MNVHVCIDMTSYAISVKIMSVCPFITFLPVNSTFEILDKEFKKVLMNNNQNYSQIVDSVVKTVSVLYNCTAQSMSCSKTYTDNYVIAK